MFRFKGIRPFRVAGSGNCVKRPLEAPIRMSTTDDSPFDEQACQTKGSHSWHRLRTGIIVADGMWWGGRHQYHPHMYASSIFSISPTTTEGKRSWGQRSVRHGPADLGTITPECPNVTLIATCISSLSSVSRSTATATKARLITAYWKLHKGLFTVLGVRRWDNEAYPDWPKKIFESKSYRMKRGSVSALGHTESLANL